MRSCPSDVAASSDDEAVVASLDVAEVVVVASAASLGADVVSAWADDETGTSCDLAWGRAGDLPHVLAATPTMAYPTHPNRVHVPYVS